MKKYAVVILLSLIVVVGVFFYRNNLRGVWPAIKSPPRDITKETTMPLTLPGGFTVSIFAKDLPGARALAFDTYGNLWVSETAAGIVSMLEINDGVVTRVNPIFTKLQKPHGLAFDPEHPGALYIAEENQIVRAHMYSDGSLEKVIDLPSGGNHNFHSIGFGPDGRLYVKIGSTCDVCLESNEQRAKIFSLNPDGSDFKEFARGLRNSPFFIWHPITKKMWATEMGRDFLGDDIPPDEINIVEEGKNYGWPNCYGKNIHDTDFDKNTYIRNPCTEPFETPSYIDLPAHSAPLGLTFVSSEIGWPKEYENNLLVAYHGSWNRTMPTGYKIVRIRLDAEGNYLGIEDFITGWLTRDGALGRPVDLLFHEDALYVSDDKAGVVYKISYPKI